MARLRRGYGEASEWREKATAGSSHGQNAAGSLREGTQGRRNDNVKSSGECEGQGEIRFGMEQGRGVPK